MRGLAGRSKKETARNWDYADSAISRQSIHAAIAVGVSAVLLASGILQPKPGGAIEGRTVLGFSALLGLAAATLLAMLSVLCYAVSKRWKEEPAVKRDLLAKASSLDVVSWYAVMMGLVWALAVASPALAICANLAYGGGLYYYYFQWRQAPLETPQRPKQLQPNIPVPHPSVPQPHDDARQQAGKPSHPLIPPTRTRR